MKIVDSRDVAPITYKNYTAGSIFRYDSNYYIKTEEVWRDGVGVNAIELAHGRVTRFDDADLIIPVDAEVVLK